MGVKCGIMDQFASLFGKKDHLIRLDTRSMEYTYFPFRPQGYRLVLLDTLVKHELASSAYNKRRQSCEQAARAVRDNGHPQVEFLRDVSMDMPRAYATGFLKRISSGRSTSLKKQNVHCGEAFKG